jgi:AI-2 transport protein TqsA
MRSPLLTLTLTVCRISLGGGLLVVGRSLLLPFIIAIIVWYMINALSNVYRRIGYGNFHLPGLVAFPLALLTIFSVSTFVLDIVAVNLTQLAQDAPTYQRRLEELFTQAADLFHLNDPVELRDLFPDSVVPRMVTAGASVVTAIAGSASLVFIYVLFLLLEQSTFDRKFEKLFATPERAKAAFAIRAEINSSLMHYFTIKTAVSVATGVLTSLVLIAIGLPYAALFGFIAFVLNYIPTIGSLIGVIFPSLLAIVYYDTLGPFLIIATGLGLIQFSIGNLIEPRLMGANLNLSGLVIMLSLALWGAIWGVVGMVLCVPLTVMIVIVCSKIEAARPVAVLLSENGEIGDLPAATQPGS